MQSEVEQVVCPKNPDHGIVSKRKLHHDDREMIPEAEGDVVEIDCPMCGKYECQDDLLATVPRQSGGSA